MKSYWVEHKGIRVFIADYSNCGNDSITLKTEADYVIAALQNEPVNSVLTISNVEGTKATQQNLQILMDVLPHTNNVVRKRCVIGVNGVRWTFVDAFNRISGRTKFQSFNSLESALDWIVQE